MSGDKTLRLTLAMRGGLSLAVWIGGAVAEIDLLRRASLREDTSDPRVTLYRKMLKDRGYGHVEVDILAGASAGGLNAVLYGLAQSYGSSVDSVRETWAEVASIWRMLRPVGIGSVDSLMQGDDYFLPEMRKALSALVVDEPAEPAFVAQNVTVELAATRLDDHTQPAWGTGAAFSFVRTAGALSTRYSTIPGAGQKKSNDGVSVALDRLALAARATSSFPGAFEPATIYSIAGGEAMFDRRPNMVRVFPFARPPGTDPVPFDVVDGGLLDNIPVDRAIRAISKASASTATERRLIYLDPEPPREKMPARTIQSAAARGALALIGSTSVMKRRTESAQDELTTLVDHNQTEVQARGRLDAFASEMRRDRSVDTDAGVERYARYRADLDAERFTDLLRNPPYFLAEPPREAQAYNRIDESVALEIRDKLYWAYVDAPELFQRDVQSVRDTASFLIAWIRELEQTATETAKTDATELGRVKKALYRLLVVTAEARQRTVFAPIVAELGLGGTIRNSAPEFVSFITTSAVAQKFLDNLPAALSRELDIDGSTAPDDAAFYSALATWGTGTGTEDAVLDRFWELVSDARSLIYRKSAHLVEWADEKSHWHSSVFAQLYSESWRGTPIHDLYSAYAATGSVPGTSSVVRYHEIRGDQFTPLVYRSFLSRPDLGLNESDLVVFDAQMQGLVDASIRTWIERWFRDATVPVELFSRTETLTTDAKLAGNVFARFGGFLSARWRMNDWRWGRMDAAAGIAAALIPDPADRTDTVAALQASIVVEGRQIDDLGLDVGAETFTDLPANYRFGLASRLLPLAARLLWPSGSAALSVASVATRIGVSVLRLLFPILVLASDALRCALVGATVLALAQTTGPTSVSVGTTAVRVLSIIAIALALGSLWRSWSTFARWGVLAKKIGTANFPPDANPDVQGGAAPYERWRSLFDVARVQALWAVGAATALSVVVGAVGIVGLARARHIGHLDVELTVIAAIAVIVLLVLTHARAGHVCEPRRAPARSRIVGWCAVVVLVAAAIVGGILGVTSSLDPWLAGLATAVVVTVSLWGWSVRAHAIGWIIAATAVGVLAAWNGPAAPITAGVWLVGVAVAYLFVPAADHIATSGGASSRTEGTPESGGSTEGAPDSRQSGE